MSLYIDCVVDKESSRSASVHENSKNERGGMMAAREIKRSDAKAKTEIRDVIKEVVKDACRKSIPSIIVLAK